MGFSLAVPSVAVFSRPGHEISILSTLHKLRAKIIFLTDGGSQNCTNESLQALASFGLAGRSVFLTNSQSSFYDAFLHLDAVFFAKVAADVRAILKDEKPEQIFCDAVEFYNPIHDMALPIVALADDAAYEGIFEVPLIYQRSSDERCEVLSAPPSTKRLIQIPLTPEESALKRATIRSHYPTLIDGMGRFLLSSADALSTETLVAARSPLRHPEAERLLRYERRAASLMKSGQILSEITHAYHYLPLVSDLLGPAYR